MYLLNVLDAIIVDMNYISNQDIMAFDLSAVSLKYYPYQTLRQKALIFEDFDCAADYFDALKKIMYDHQGIGLAANQVGLLKRIFVMDLSESRDSPIFIANPEVLTTSKELHSVHEGCLSLPGIQAKIFRPKTVTLRYQNLEGLWVEQEFSDLASSCVQHEIDHLNGLMFPDKLSSAQDSAKIWKKYKAPSTN